MSKKDQKYTNTFNHKTELQEMVKCGCFSCRCIFDYEDITEWIEDGQTAKCPDCGAVSVAGFDSHFLVLNNNLIKSYRNHIFRGLDGK